MARRLLVVPALAALAACGRGDGVPDDKLGGLVVEARPDAAIDVELAARDPGELGRALGRPYAAAIAALGPHRATIDTRNTVEEAGKPVNELSDRAVIEHGDRGSFRAVYTNSGDYGRETVFTDGALYLRPRYQAWHRRAPEPADEPDQLREQYFGGIAATWDLLAPGVELTDRGAIQIEGRAGRKIEVKAAPAPRRPPREPLVQRRWREGRAIEAVAGEVVLDRESGAPLAVKLTGTIGFSRDGRRFTMRLALDAAVTGIGRPVAIPAPPEADVVATPERAKEVGDRDFLLDGIAPPQRHRPDAGKRPEDKP